jgi:hypothetical protein
VPFLLVKINFTKSHNNTYTNVTKILRRTASHRLEIDISRIPHCMTIPGHRSKWAGETGAQ